MLALFVGYLLWADGGQRRAAPSYSAEGILNSASNVAGPLAPYTLASVYGENLSYCEDRPLKMSDISGGKLPTVFLDCGTRVWVGGIPAVLFYVSPKQINFLIPTLLRGSEVRFQVFRDGVVGPTVMVRLEDAAPALFQLDARTLIASHPDWSVVTDAAPASPGEAVVLYATGLGPTLPDVVYGQIAPGAAPLERFSEFQVLVARTALERERISYAGTMPGVAGVYQLNLRLPDSVEDDPEIRISLGEKTSPAGLRLPLRKPAETAAEATRPQQNPALARYYK